jgi:hypothetical protein
MKERISSLFKPIFQSYGIVPPDCPTTGKPLNIVSGYNEENIQCEDCTFEICFKNNRGEVIK